ncbi:MAG: hypothetical protein R3B06_25370 [Kofleriaceae bacterium]
MTSRRRTTRGLGATALLLAATLLGCRSLARGGDGFAASLTYQAAAIVRAPADGTAAPPPGPRAQGELTVRLAAMVGRRVGPLVGLSLAGGGGAPLGASYDVALVPIGIGARLHRSSFVGIGLALATTGGSSTDDAIVVAGQAYAELALGHRLRLLSYARLGSDQLIADGLDRRRLEVTAAVRLGHSFDRFIPASNGYYLGATWRGQQGQEQWGLVIGHSLDAGR